MMRGNRRGNRRKWNRGGGGGNGGQYNQNHNSANPRSILTLDNNDNDFEMGVYDRESGNRGPQRYTPYGAAASGSGRQRRGGGRYNWHNQGTSSGEGAYNKPPYSEGANYSQHHQGGRGGNNNKRNSGGRGPGGGPNRCFRVVVPGLKRERGISKEWLIQSLQNLSSVPFQPIGLQVLNDAASFYVEGHHAANALKETSRRITTSSGTHLIVIVTPMKETPPIVKQNSVLDTEISELVKKVMSKRYDVHSKHLNLSNFYSDPDLKDKNLPLGRYTVMNTVVKVIGEYIPEVSTIDLSSNKLYSLEYFKPITKSAKNVTKLNLSKNSIKTLAELDRIKSWKLSELILDGNPVCGNFSQQLTYISEIRKRFPKVMMLDGSELPPPISFGDEEQETCLPPVKGSFFMNQQLEQMIPQFLAEYFKAYDSGDRQGLLDAYHDSACFSLVAGCHDLHTKGTSLKRFFSDSRNLIRVTSPALRTKLLLRSRLSVVAFLNSLPDTEHNIQSLVIDVNLCQGTLLMFTISGIHKEIKDSQDKNQYTIYRAFTRVFCATPSPTGGLLLTNDELYIRNLTETENKFVTEGVLLPTLQPAPTELPLSTRGALSVPSQPVVDQQKQEQLVLLLSQQSGMNLKWAFECLKQNDWNIEESYRIFTELQTQGKVPPEAFQK